MRACRALQPLAKHRRVGRAARRKRIRRLLVTDQLLEAARGVGLRRRRQRRLLPPSTSALSRLRCGRRGVFIHGRDFRLAQLIVGPVALRIGYSGCCAAETARRGEKDPRSESDSFRALRGKAAARRCASLRFDIEWPSCNSASALAALAWRSRNAASCSAVFSRSSGASGAP